MDRLTLIKMIDPVWGTQVDDFLEAHPEFKPYTFLAPVTTKPICDDPPKNVLEALMYYIALAGVHRTYGHKQKDLIWNTLRLNGYNITNMIATIGKSLQPKKREVYLEVEKYCKNHGIEPKDLTVDMVLDPRFKSIKGVGNGAISHVKLTYTDSMDIIDYTDRGFIRGFEHIYHTKSSSDIKRITASWAPNQKIGTAFCFQIYNHLISK